VGARRNEGSMQFTLLGYFRAACFGGSLSLMMEAERQSKTEKIESPTAVHQ